MRVETVDGEGFGLLLTDVKVPSLSDVVKAGDEPIEVCCGITDDGHVVSVQENLNKVKELIGAAMDYVELSVNDVTDGDAFIAVLDGLVDDVIEEEVEECWGEDTPLADAIVDVERI